MSNLHGPRMRANPNQGLATLIRRADAVAATLAVAVVAVTFLATLTGTAAARTLPAGLEANASKTSGGGAVAGTPVSAQTAPGAKARLTSSGLAIPPAAAPAKVKAAIRAGNKIAKKPYKWGGGHAILEDSGYDCSGSVSYALRGGRLMTSSMASTGFMSWGRRGPGRWITIRANGGHVYMLIAGLRFDTSARGIGGSRWTAQMRSPRGYVATHPAGL
jgi:hypothetical protein